MSDQPHRTVYCCPCACCRQQPHGAVAIEHQAITRLLEWSAPVRAELALEPALPELNGAQRQRRMIEAGAGMDEVFAATVRETRETYAQEVAA